MTPLWSAADLCAATGGTMPLPFAATGVSIDTRTLRPGDLFVALRGDHSDGHAHVAAARAAGAAGAMVHADMPEAGLLRVPDTQLGLVELGRFARARYAGPVIAVTGSVGKTTTKEMLRRCLSDARGGAHAAEASHNNHWGVPLTLARLPTDARACIVEIGMNHAGEIAPLSRLARPDVAVITTIGAAHVGHLGSLAAIADEKATIAAGLAATGVAVLPADSPLLPRLRAAIRQRVMTFGVAADADARLMELHPAPDHSRIDAVIAGQPVSFSLGAPGRHMALNALAALAACHAAGFDVHAAAAGLAGFTAGAGRGAIRRIGVAGGEALLLDESYNASSASIRAGLAVLALQPARRRIAVLGDMLELGAHAQAEHVGLAEAAGAADLVFTCGPCMRLLFDTLPPARRGVHAADAEALAPLLAAAIRPGDAILVKGSLGSRMRLVVAALDALGRASRAA